MYECWLHCRDDELNDWHCRLIHAARMNGVCVLCVCTGEMSVKLLSECAEFGARFSTALVHSCQDGRVV